MISESPRPSSLAVCNSLLLGNERFSMELAVTYDLAGRHGDAERLRERLGYGSAACRDDVNKVSR